MNLTGSDLRNGRGTSPAPGPFGYSFLSSFDTPYDPAPAPPPGPALLDDSESNMLDNFFTTMNANHLDTSDFWFRGQQPVKGPSNLDWSEGLPPIFEGSTTTLGQPSALQHGLGKGAFSTADNGMETSSDILAAASMLYGNGMNANGFSSPFSHQLFPDHTLHNANRNFSVKGGVSKNSATGDQPAMEETGPQIARKQPLPRGYHAPEMFFDVQQPVTMDQQTVAKVRTLRWGSDASFMDQGYLPPPQHNMEERTKDLLDKLECFEPQSSAANTRAPSPVRMTGNGDWASLHGGYMPSGLRNDENVSDQLQPRKRQKSMVKAEDADSDVDASRSRTKKTKTSSQDKARRNSSDAGSRKAKQGSGKHARENLTEEQKRTNHILSEQKRRNLIKQGFDELCSLVPELRGGGFSKSAMLMQAADWLQDMLHGNEILKAQLADLKAVDGIRMPR
ncbi:transcriptional regulator family: Helix-loop-helix [Paecilomyces variotii]|nr:transcriptional regulator family: Helix-loop-helix [Paecilomyces variotii]KAJ9224755.1 transcriptional regulator family: Helix-loop-helix [Paecilomyces variotii]KAJ9283020.1 transcriptional regulator family: Helix-loop-helix [Paecilomyces variotii]KAJ9313505.1 transcriptional regulator family: Helix-loop-helix [Paecilomyces variotii]KAJ9346811.1 transcriptional regulator family: Helix-loop-helix [Paecilomyces variotii]